METLKFTGRRGASIGGGDGEPTWFGQQLVMVSREAMQHGQLVGGDVDSMRISMFNGRKCYL